MPSPLHEAYLETLEESIRCLALNPAHMHDIKYFKDALLLMCAIDLGPAMPILDRCYSDSPRGSERKDPLSVFRMLLLGACIGVMKINALVRRLRHSPVLATIAGFPPCAKGNSSVPCVATVYELLHRLHDGPIRRVRGAVRPSVVEFEKTRAEMPPTVRHGKDAVDDPALDADMVPSEAKGRKKGAKSAKRKNPRESYRNRSRNTKKVTEALRVTLGKEDTNTLPDDLPTRLLEILHVVALRQSAEAGLLGDLDALLVAGDGSPLVTNSDGHGEKGDACPHSRWEHCDCPRKWSDPDAARGWDHYRETYYFGYSFYEFISVGGSKELPLFIALNPANTNDSVASMRALSTLNRFCCRAEVEYEIDTFIADCGHDGEPLHHYVYHDLGILPVIPISGEVPAVHPIRKDLHLDPKTAVPLCKAGCPMASWGTAGEGRTSYICPVKAGKIEKCPLAPEDNPEWVCHPEQKYGPSVVLNVSDNARLFPAIPRGSKKFKDLYNMRSACERFHAYVKGIGHIDDCGHRRWSFWSIRLYMAAILQHARAWVESMDAELHLRKLLGMEAMSTAA
jgi:hypothetical protein